VETITSTEEKRPVAVLVTGEPIEAARLRRGGFATLIRDALAPLEVPLVEVDARAESLSALTEFAAVIITGSSASVTERAPWMLAAEAELRRAVASGTPVFGICFGHQLLAQALGGRVAKNPLGREIGSVALSTAGADALFDGLESTLVANMTHVDAVVELPAGAVVVARSELDPHAALRFGERVWGVQFHPEIDAEVLADYVAGRHDLIVSEGLDAERIAREIRETPASRALIARFLELVGVAGERRGG
jgi:GMP synthase (glutamine-hydrolysing)